MIVVAIVGILVTVDLPAYQDYVVHSKISEALVAMSTCRVEATEKIQTGMGLAWVSVTHPGVGQSEQWFALCGAGFV